MRHRAVTRVRRSSSAPTPQLEGLPSSAHRRINPLPTNPNKLPSHQKRRAFPIPVPPKPLTFTWRCCQPWCANSQHPGINSVQSTPIPEATPLLTSSGCQHASAVKATRRTSRSRDIGTRSPQVLTSVVYRLCTSQHKGDDRVSPLRKEVYGRGWVFGTERRVGWRWGRMIGGHRVRSGSEQDEGAVLLRVEVCVEITHAGTIRPR